MKYSANPVVVEAFVIVAVSAVDALGGVCVRLRADGDKVEEKTLTPGMVARYMPVVGDYLVRQADGYEYVNPKDVFERKYHPLANPAVLMPRVPDIARVCHEANRAYCQSLGDDSQLAWDEAPAWARESAKNGVKFAILNPGSTPEASHENWLREKFAAGWKVGPVKDPAKKEHPCCVAYAQLPLAQRRKDSLFQAVVRALTEVGEIVAHPDELKPLVPTVSEE